eukprot:CAMPEP_0174878244 /NCGR_PEP_ID=MMETSP1114-20130205/82658_1 /TAXON_ID=312471 /ORGANISM="Neobodo designis, Strain CCAP 1951/1" /LENGTH=1031 /DNA_ID=CAMNT_0016113631 /DNA_START=233 /DNA_END=3327 /DNA_ORIENTATION=-
MPLSLKVTLGAVNAVAVVVVAAVTLGIALSTSLAALDAIGQRHAGVLAGVARSDTEGLFAQGTQYAMAIANLTGSREWTVPSSVTDPVDANRTAEVMLRAMQTHHVRGAPHIESCVLSFVDGSHPPVQMDLEYAGPPRYSLSVSKPRAPYDANDTSTHHVNEERAYYDVATNVEVQPFAPHPTPPTLSNRAGALWSQMAAATFNAYAPVIFPPVSIPGATPGTISRVTGCAAPIYAPNAPARTTEHVFAYIISAINLDAMDGFLRDAKSTPNTAVFARLRDHDDQHGRDGRFPPRRQVDAEHGGLRVRPARLPPFVDGRTRDVRRAPAQHRRPNRLFLDSGVRRRRGGSCNIPPRVREAGQRLRAPGAHRRRDGARGAAVPGAGGEPGPIAEAAGRARVRGVGACGAGVPGAGAVPAADHARGGRAGGRHLGAQRGDRRDVRAGGGVHGGERGADLGAAVAAGGRGGADAEGGELRGRRGGRRHLGDERGGGAAGGVLRDERAANFEDDGEDDAISAMSEVAELQEAYYAMNAELRHIRSFVPQSVLEARREERDAAKTGASLHDDDLDMGSISFMSRGSANDNSPKAAAASRRGTRSEVSSTSGSVSARGRMSTSAAMGMSLSGSTERSRYGAATARNVTMRNVSVLCGNLVGLHAATGDDGGSHTLSVVAGEVSLLVEHVERAVRAEQGVVTFHGDRVLATFNAAAAVRVAREPGGGGGTEHGGCFRGGEPAGGVVRGGDGAVRGGQRGQRDAEGAVGGGAVRDARGGAGAVRAQPRPSSSSERHHDHDHDQEEQHGDRVAPDGERDDGGADRGAVRGPGAAGGVGRGFETDRGKSSVIASHRTVSEMTGAPIVARYVDLVLLEGWGGTAKPTAVAEMLRPAAKSADGQRDGGDAPADTQGAAGHPNGADEEWLYVVGAAHEDRRSAFNAVFTLLQCDDVAAALATYDRVLTDAAASNHGENIEPPVALAGMADTLRSQPGATVGTCAFDPTAAFTHRMRAKHSTAPDGSTIVPQVNATPPGVVTTPQR